MAAYVYVLHMWRCTCCTCGGVHVAPVAVYVLHMWQGSELAQWSRGRKLEGVQIKGSEFKGFGGAGGRGNLFTHFFSFP